MTNKEEYTSGEVVLLSPPDPEPGEPYFTIKSACFGSSWKDEDTIKISPPRRQPVVKVFKTIAVLTMLIPAVWMVVGMVLSVVVTQ